MFLISDKREIRNSLIVSNKIIFRLKSRIISDYVLDRSQAKVIVGRKYSKPIILKLKPDAGRDTVTLGPVSNSLWLNKGNRVIINQPPVD